MLNRALNYGYDQGYRAGQADRYDGWGYDYNASYGYQDASYGYDSYYVSYGEYQYYFREGFRRGYDDGYYGRRRYGRYSGGKYSLLINVIRGIISIFRY